MAHPTLDLENDTFTFTNGPVEIKAKVDIDLLQRSITVESVALENRGTTVDLPIMEFDVPPPVAERLFEQGSTGLSFDLLI
jgi:hypothetical protein